MSLYDKIKAIYPQLTENDFHPDRGTVQLQNDGRGDYIAAWNHPTLPRPTEEQLA
jgi:hypothetical protein